jgi:hypothetical protein
MKTQSRFILYFILFLLVNVLATVFTYLAEGWRFELFAWNDQIFTMKPQWLALGLNCIACVGFYLADQKLNVLSRS